MISDRTLKKWRKDALIARTIQVYDKEDKSPYTILAKEKAELAERIIVLTQEISDSRLIKRGY